jgi:xanthine dehydrogenase small subunit
VAVAVAIDLDEAGAGMIERVRLGVGGIAATPIRALATEAALAGRPWSLESLSTAAEVLAGEGTPIDDHRASAAYRRAMLRTSLLKMYAESSVELVAVGGE